MEPLPLFITQSQRFSEDVGMNFYIITQIYWRRSHHDFVTNVLDHKIVVNKFELEPRYCIHFQINTLGRGMNSLSP